MKTTLLGMVGVMMISALSVSAAFTEPTDAQLTAAANDPAAIAALLVGASSEQAAQVIKAVVVQIAAMDLTASAQGTKISAVVAAAFSSVPAGSASLLAANLGTACGASVAVSGNPAVVSSIQSAIATSGGSAGAALAETFGTAYTKAKAEQTAGKDDSAPPVATGYPGQK